MIIMLKTQVEHIKEAFEKGLSVTIHYTDQWSNSRQLTFDTWKEYVLGCPNSNDYFTTSLKTNNEDI